MWWGTNIYSRINLKKTIHGIILDQKSKKKLFSFSETTVFDRVRQRKWDFPMTFECYYIWSLRTVRLWNHHVTDLKNTSSRQPAVLYLTAFSQQHSEGIWSTSATWIMAWLSWLELCLVYLVPGKNCRPHHFQTAELWVICHAQWGKNGKGAKKKKTVPHL